MIKNPILLHCAAAISATVAVSWLEIRPFGVFFIVLLALWLYRWKCPTVKIVPPPEFSVKLNSVYDRIAQLRQDRPSFFCAILCGILVALAVVGHIVSGACIVVFGLIMAGLISTKYQFQILKDENRLSQIWSSQNTDHEVDEFLPEYNESNIFVLERASDEALFSSSTLTAGDEDDDNSEEVPSELMIPDPIPEIDENTSGGSSEDDLLPDASAVKKQTMPLDQQTMEFKTGYFKRDSTTPSSSDEDSLSKGLNFQNYSVMDDTDANRRSKSREPDKAATSSSSSLLPNLVSGLVPWNLGNELAERITGSLLSAAVQSTQQQQQQQPQQHRHHHTAGDSSDDSEFEILDSDDLNNTS